MKNLVSIGQIMEQGTQVQLNDGGCFIKKEGQIRREGRMLILDSHEMKSTMFAKGHTTNTDIELWHKRINHINLQKLKGVIIWLSTFTEKEIASVS